jgi:hypothetical protein
MLGEKPWSEWSLRNEVLKAETGFNKEEFEFIFTLCKDSLQGFHGTKRMRHSSPMAPSKTFLSRHNLLLLVLVSLWKNPTEMTLADTFKTPRKTIVDTRTRLYPLLLPCLAHFIQVPQHQTPRIETEPLTGVQLVVDSTPTPIPKPQLREDRKLYYNFKKRPTPYAMKTQIAVGLDLKIWDVSSTYPHSVHDLKVLDESMVPGLLHEQKKALGDSAYQSAPNFVTPFKKPRGGELKRSEKLFNKKLNHVRVTVENVFKRVKDFRIVSNIYRGDYHNLQEFNVIFKLVCALVNIHFQKNPIRRNQAQRQKLKKAKNLG